MTTWQLLWRMLALAVFVVGMVMVITMVPLPEAKPDAAGVPQFPPSVYTVHRTIDLELGVACYTSREALSCVRVKP